MRWDLIVVGAGSAGLTSAIAAGELGARVLLVDRERIGGECTWTGCVPSKALIHCARVAHDSRGTTSFGVHVGETRVDFGGVMAHVRRVQQQIAASEGPSVLADHGVEVAMGGATFIDPHTVRIGTDRTEQADRFVLATGSHAAMPDVPGLAGVSPLTNDTLFDLTELPTHLVVLGGGPIGVEMAQAFRRLGSEVTLLEHGERVLHPTTIAASAHLQRVLQAEGVRLVTGTDVTAVRRMAGGVCIEGRHATGRYAIDGSHLLVAVGRRANVHDLGLQEAGVELVDGHIHVDDHLRTSASHIFAVGDVIGGLRFTHQAEREARTATRNALFRGRQRHYTDHVPWVIFTDPEVASVGLTADEARRQDLDAHVHSISFDRVDRAVCTGNGDGFLEVVVDRSERILGVTIVARDAGELLPEWVMALEQGLTLTALGDLVHAYPTMARANRRVADAAFFAHGIPGWQKTLGATFRGRR